ncbi:T9SS-dependent M36 family metallopeptidase [uncultured Algibacter sp.]|uniref:T9SS-dependent M36 family metallopeptidase n=1 Tax=uncultured Algibacter sp. TaxID=298659 RepID=UPI002615858D|nr:T9SS-dependent M36 family metallopeptidase [uncultured Algibacter sp.]
MERNYKKIVIVVFLLVFTFSAKAQSELSKSKYAGIITSYLNSSENASKVSNSDLSDIYVNKELFSEKTGIANVYLNQRFKGIKIFNSISVVGIKNNKVFHYADKFKSNIESKINTSTPSLTKEQAIQKAASYFKLGDTGNVKLINQLEEKTFFSKGAISQEDIPLELVYFQLQDESLRLSWDLSIYTLDSKHWWSIRVDAVTGEILNINDWIVSCNFKGDHTSHGVNHNTKSLQKPTIDLFKTNNFLVADGSEYTVFPIPVESPNHGSRQVVSEPADDIASPFGWHDDNGAVGAEYTTTRGNNVVAQLDDDGNNGEGFSPDGTASLDFNFSLDLNAEPAVSREAAITNLFYMNNIMHDIWYQYGFDEASGNFQQNNYGKSSPRTAGDPVNADAQDGSSLNNANFGTPPDANSPRMQMFLWNTPNTVPLLTINNTSLAGGYLAVLPSNGEGDNGTGNITRPNETPITGDVVLVDDGTTAGEEGCNALTNGASVAGKIAIIRRGTCPFTDKIQNAQNAGAIAVIVANHNNPDNDPNYVEYVNMYGVTNPVFTIPSIFINFTDGEAIISAINNAETVNATIVNNPGILLDGDYDNLVIAHEYGHGISNRLTGGAFASDCVLNCTERDSEGRCVPSTNTEVMGEGWSDWFGLMLTMKSSDSASDSRTVGTFVSSQPTNGSGIRPFPYNPDTNVNPMTYNTTNDTANISAPHGVGSVWCTMLWDLTWKYIEKYGFDPDLYYGTGGNNKIMQIVMDGLKLQPCNPGFVDGRDAILAADIALTGGEDQCMIWEVFAARGLGLNANQGSPLLRVDQTEDFTMPDPSDPSLANCTTLSAAKFNTNDYSIFPNPTSSLITLKAKKDLGDVTLTLVDINGREVKTLKTSLIGEVDMDVSAVQSGLYILNIKGDYIDTNEKIVIK